MESASNGGGARYSLKKAIQASFGAPDNPDYIFDISTSGDSMMAVSLSTNGIKLYSPVKDKLLGELSGHTSTITDIAFPSPLAPHKLCSSSTDGTLRIWDTRTHRQIGCLKSPSPRELWSFSLGGMSGNLIAAGSQAQIMFWDWRTKKQLGCLEECHTEDVTQVRFHPNKMDKLLSASVDGLMCAIDTSGGINDDEGLDSVLSVGTSVARVGFYGESNEKVWCLTHTESLSVWNFEEKRLEADFGDTRSRASAAWSLTPVNYLIDCHYSPTLDGLCLVAGTLGGTIGMFPVNYTKCGGDTHCSGQIGPVCSVLEGGHTAVVRSVKTFDQSELFCWSGGEDGRLCSWSKPSSSSEFESSAWVSSNLVLKRAKQSNKRHVPY
ncbi:WD repeat-containing protein GTS1 [Selaginella moellendorffii]|uniref:WD repeat-containing protein GTS1 n=1 Tax=Selaginella moellendorffii TaxID=88036 RepID=UPI000D1C30C0|nr:WD repeat-containing protein GTS1 [Selaginella moellendorffii]|eukprot:XP_024517926.1 WD repeat-containing protein GTS1 [Selaginella moellendorffii]